MKCAVRAPLIAFITDTIDLQNQDSPSAKDHTRQPNRPGALGEGPPAPHQADALKHVEHEINEQHGRSPRASQDLSGKELGLLHHEDGDTYGVNDGVSQDASSTVRNTSVSGTTAVEEDLTDVDDDESDDDLMDKISSSPSIGDDGGYHLPLPLPKRGTSLRSSTPPPKMTPSPGSSSDKFSSSPFNETPRHFPLSFPRDEQDHSPSKDHHQQGRYVRNRDSGSIITVDEVETGRLRRSNPEVDEQEKEDFQNENNSDDLEESYEEAFDPSDFRHLLLPADDPLLDNSFDDASQSSDGSSTVSRQSWEEGEEFQMADDDTKDISFVDRSRFIDSGWGGECLRETEDIDFDFVYALHTFVATVEGQANATKGDTMVLLDDSNSYWWLVRVVKDSSIGYLPAEHIETPLERLARLNKHRNLDLSQTMLGDEEEKKPNNSMNPLKRAMQRRNTKTVQFTAPSFVEPSDVEYSSDEEGEDDRDYLGQEQDDEVAQTIDQGKELEEPAAVEPLRPRGQVRDNKPNGEIVETATRNGNLGQNIQAEDTRMSDENSDRSGDANTTKSRKGTVRNTDSFFKDDSVETRKINLTPSLLRDDSKGAVTTSVEAIDLKNRPSLDSLEKEPSNEKTKDDKKRKEKRGMLGGMFKRKDKKSKGQEKELEEVEKVSNEVSRQSPQPKESLENLTQEPQATRSASQAQKQAGKLQKSPPTKVSPKSPYSPKEPAATRSIPAEQQTNYIPEPSRPPPPASEPNRSIHLVQPEPDIVTEDTAPALNFNPAVQSYEEPGEPDSPNLGKQGLFSSIKDAVRSPSESKPEQARQAQTRMQMNDFDTSSSEDEPTERDPSAGEFQDEGERHLAIAQNAQYDQHDEEAASLHQTESAKERLSESPVEVTPPQDFQPTPPPEPQRTPHQPPPLMIDTSSQEDPSTSPISPSSSPELVEAPDENATREETPASTAQSSTPTWSDASLRAYMDDDSEIRDLLVVVYDKSNTKPARRDHPIVKNMYKEENRQLREISNQLDGLLGDYLSRKSGAQTR
ncbi:protein phosphatase regulator [Lecanora helva]